MFSPNRRLPILIVLVMLNSSTVLSQIVLRIGNHECSSHLVKDKALLDAIKTGNLTSVKRLLRQGSNPNAQDDCHVSAVTYAAALLRPDILKELTTAGARVDIIDDFDHKSALLWALDFTEVENSQRAYEVVKLLLEAGGDVNLRDPFASTALILCTTRGLDKVTELLINKGADINAEDDDDRTAYSYAAQLGNRKLKELLIAGGADINIGVTAYRERFGQNAFIQAASDGRTDIVEAMLANGTYANSANQAGVTALMRVVEDSTLDTLLAAGADVNRKDNAGYTALMWASFFGRAAQIKKLISFGADVNAITHDGKTALNMANREVKSILTDAGAKN